MARTYTTYEAKARFSEILRQVRAGHPVRVSYHGRDVAEIRPISEPRNPELVLKKLEEEGVLVAPVTPEAPLQGVIRRRGALERFLERRR